MKTFFAFFIGLIVGAFFGMMTAALMVVASDADQRSASDFNNINKGDYDE